VSEFFFEAPDNMLRELVIDFRCDKSPIVKNLLEKANPDALDDGFRDDLYSSD